MDYKFLLGIILPLIAVSFTLGFYVSTYIRMKRLKEESDEITNNVNDFYNLVLDKLYLNETRFSERVNNTVTLHVDIDYIEYTIMYMIDKKDVAIFKEDKCIYTSDLVGEELLFYIVDAIDDLYDDEINDTINVMGFIFSKDAFEKKFNIKIEDMVKGIQPNLSKEESDLDKIVNDNETLFDIDDVLDRINKVGIDHLTKEEKTFLDKYSSK